jgi:type VI protein secretion system component Hcp
MESETPRGGRRVWRGLPVSWKVLVPAVVALGFGVGGAVAAGSIGSNGTITGCYLTPAGAISNEDQTVGALRVINQPDEITDTTDPDATSCESVSEDTVTWNQQGPTGPQGSPGQNGLNGQNGATGGTGPAGGVSASPGSNTAVIMELTPSNPNLGGLNSIPVGESQVSGSQNQEFNVTSFDLGASSPTLNIGSQSAGAGAGKVTFQPFTVTKTVDRYSSDLFLDLAAGKALASAEIIVRKPDATGTATPVAQYLMKDVLLTSVHISGTAKNTTETIQGEYAAIQFVFYGQTKSGTTEPVSSGGWSRVTNSQTPTPTIVPVVGGATSKRHRRRH